MTNLGMSIYRGHCPKCSGKEWVLFSTPDPLEVQCIVCQFVLNMSGEPSAEAKASAAEQARSDFKLLQFPKPEVDPLEGVMKMLGALMPPRDPPPSRLERIVCVMLQSNPVISATRGSPVEVVDALMQFCMAIDQRIDAYEKAKAT